MHFLEPIAPKNLTSTELKEIVFEKMWSYYVKKK
jgi:hypothetical protein